MFKRKRKGDGVPQKGKGIARWHMVRRTRKYRKRGRERKGCQENIQNLERSVVGHRNRKSRYT